MKNTSVVRHALILGSLAFTAASVVAAPQSFDFKDPKGVNHVQFLLDAPLEAIAGTGDGVSGTILFDTAAPATLTGSIVLETKTLTVSNSMMKDHIHSPKWLDVAQYPTITFEATKVANVQTKGPQILADVTGKLTVKGVTKEITVPVSFTYLADKLGARLGKDSIKGDLLVLRSTFTINRSDYGIMAGQNAEKVAESIELTFAIAGASPRI